MTGLAGINDLSAVRAFVAVANSGSFARAADLCGLTRSAVGKAVSRLEEQLGTRLLQRSTRSVGLTVEGELFLERGSQILADLDEVEASIRQDQAEPVGILRLTVPGSYGRLRILPILHRYLAAWPNIKAEVNFSDRVIDLVEEGYDLSVRIGAVPTDTQLITRVIAHSSTILCAAPSYLETHPAPLTLEEITHHRRLAFGSRRRPLPWQFHKPDKTIAVIDTSPYMLFDSADAIRDATLLGSGIAYLPDFLIEEDIHAGRLVALLPDHKTEKLPIFAIYPSRRHLSNKVRLFLDMLTNSTNSIAVRR